MMRTTPKENEIYHHFKGNDYQIVAIAKHSETMEEMVVYKALYGDGGVYVRPLEMFMSEVDHEKYPEVTQTYRFEKAEAVVDPGLMEFLDADTCEERMKILAHMQPRLTNRLLDTMSSALDIDLKDGDVEDRYYDFLRCLEIRGRFENRRLRGD